MRHLATQNGSREVKRGLQEASSILWTTLWRHLKTISNSLKKRLRATYTSKPWFEQCLNLAPEQPCAQHSLSELLIPTKCVEASKLAAIRFLVKRMFASHLPANL